MGWRSWLARMGIKTSFPVRRFAPLFEVEAALADYPGEEEPEVFLFEDVVDLLHPDGGRTRRYHCLVHLQDPRFLDGWEQQHDSVPAGKGRFKVFAARHLPPGGRWTKARIDPYQAMVGTSLVDALQVTFEGLVPGCLLEYGVQVDLYGASSWGPHLFDEFFFVTPAPSRARRLVVAVPEGAPLTLLERNGPPEAHRESRGRYAIHRWEARDLRGYSADGATPPPRDDVACVEISSCPDWAPIVERYREQMQVAPDQRALPPGIPEADPTADPLVRAREAFAYVSRKIRYGRPQAVVDVLSARSPGTTASELRGDCKDKVNLLASLLERDGWHCDFVLVETQTGTRSHFAPAPRFDHVLLRATRDGRTLWLEPTPGFEDFDYVPGFLQGSPGLSLAPGNATLETLPLLPLERNMHRLELEGRLDEEGNLRLSHAQTFTGTYALERREFLVRTPKDHWADDLGRIRASEVPGARLEELEVEDSETLEHPLRHTLIEVLPRWVRTAGRYRLLRLPWTYRANASLVSAGQREIGLIAGNRRREQETLELRLPPGWQLAGGEIERSWSSPWLDYALTVEAVEGEGRVRATRRCDILERVVPASAYPEFKRIFEDVARADRHDLVLSER